ncbi:hypothetical protein N8512_00410 [Akkermansiaceae bacterium]|nr:hypothetical protein [Akkermansiaceae bacterium]
MKINSVVSGFLAFCGLVFALEPAIYRAKEKSIVDPSEKFVFSGKKVEAAVIGSSRSARGFSAELVSKVAG